MWDIGFGGDLYRAGAFDRSLSARNLDGDLVGGSCDSMHHCRCYDYYSAVQEKTAQ